MRLDQKASYQKNAASISHQIFLSKQTLILRKSVSVLRFRSSGPEVFCQKGVLKNFSNILEVA